MREQNGVDPKRSSTRSGERLRELDSERVYQDVEEPARLQTLVAEGLKRFEYVCAARSAMRPCALVSGYEEVPAEFKALVEEYYRSLSKARQNAEPMKNKE